MFLKKKEGNNKKKNYWFGQFARNSLTTKFTGQFEVSLHYIHSHTLDSPIKYFKSFRIFRHLQERNNNMFQW